MTPRRAITPPDCRASLRAVKPLRFAPTPFGAGGLDGPSGPPRIGNYVMAGMHPTNELTRRKERREPCTTPTNHAQHRGDDRTRDAAVPRVHYHGTRKVRRAGDGHAPHRAAFGRVGHRCEPDLAQQPRRCLDAARPRGRHRARLAARAISRTGPSLRARRSRARRPEHAAALAVEPDRFAGRGPRTRKRIAAVNNAARPSSRATSWRNVMNIEVKILPQRTDQRRSGSSQTPRSTSSAENSPASSSWASLCGNGGMDTDAASRFPRGSSSCTATSATSLCCAPSATRTLKITCAIWCSEHTSSR